MLSLPPPELDDEVIFDSIASAKLNPTKAHLRAARAIVLIAYEAYVAVAPSVETLAPVGLSDDQGRALIHAYDVATKPLEDLRDQLLIRADAAICPFCGISAAGTLDHYLPKQAYPAYSVYSRNLVPSCSDCNNTKGTSIIDPASGSRLLLHPYFDQLPDERFLGASVALAAGAVDLEYKIDRTAGMPLVTYLHLERHFRALGLSDRYRLMSLNLVPKIAKALRTRYGGRGDVRWEVRQALAEQAQLESELSGLNNWRAVLYGALAESEAFCSGGFEAI